MEKASMEVDLDDWEFLPDDHQHHHKGVIFSNDFNFGSRGLVDVNYFIIRPSHPPLLTPSKDECKQAERQDHDGKDDKVFKDIEVVPQDVVSQVFFKKWKENEFVDMKLDLEVDLDLDSPKSISRGSTPLKDAGALCFDEEECEKDLDESFQVKAENKEKSCRDDFGITLWRWRLTGVGALCSIGVAAATICILLLGGRQRPQQHLQCQRLQFQIYSDEQRIKQVVQKASRLNQALSTMRGASSSPPLIARNSGELHSTVNCSVLSKGCPCFIPELLSSHASVAMNLYFDFHGRNHWNCDFNGTGLLSVSDPSVAKEVGFQGLRMEKEMKSSQRPPRIAPEPDFPLQWGSRKRLRCVRVRDETTPERSDGRRRATSRINRRIVDKDLSFPPLLPIPLHQRLPESAGSDSRKSRSASLSPEKEDRFYTTRGSLAACEENGHGIGVEERGTGATAAMPRFFVSLSNKEKEEDFMAMKGCKLPQRPRKRSKLIQKCLLLVSPGAWLSELSHERYEVREKKSSRKRRRGLKAMCLETDSE
ncbi:hypothetical protein J5N97_010958 [Dioscorea zingiberensis]|uniref:X8 domain-containing protein n=1 Tax=Dioscorea zingiberensis TaxID=325984 RepID=A0A9D5D248_9LILI|nr:hypothetical protein J5N97_010958 [Dioscorea zingiberensis]